MIGVCKERWKFGNNDAIVVSLIGMSSSGKSTIGTKLCQRLKQYYPNTVLLDGDALRSVIAPELGYSFDDRRESEARRSKLCKFLSDQGIHVICAGLTNYPEWRQWCRDHIEGYFEVYLQVPFSTLTKRDNKGLYKKALEGTITNVVGVDIEFRQPNNPDLVIDNSGIFSEEEVVTMIWDRLPLDQSFTSGE